MRRPPCGFLLFLVVLFLIGTVQGQNSVSGTVIDPNAAAVPDCSLQLLNSIGIVVQAAQTDMHGRFGLRAELPGDYVLTVPAGHGFAMAAVPVHLGKTPIVGLEVHLDLDTVVEKVEVAGESTTVAPDAAANSDQVAASSQMIDKIPVLGQDIVATFAPFLSQTGIGSKGVILVVDGIETKGTGVSASAIKSVSINNDPYSAESNRPGKGRIEILTKAGTSTFHGTFNFTFRDATLDAATPFSRTRPVEQRRIYEGNVTGPLGKGERTTFLVSGTRQEDDLESIVFASDANGTISANVPAPTHTTLFAVRAAHLLSPNHRFSLQYNVEDVITRNQGAGGLVLQSAGVNSQSREDDIVFNDSLTAGTNLVNQF